MNYENMLIKTQFKAIKIALPKTLKAKIFLGFWSLFFFQTTFSQTLSLGSNQIICSGSNTATVDAIVSNPQGLAISSYSWTINGVSAGTSTSTSISVNANLSPINPQVIYCLVTLSDGTNVTTIEDEMLVYTINPGVISGDQFSCTSPFDPLEITSSNDGSTTLSGVSNFSSSYQWEYSNSASGPWTVIPSSNTSTYDPSSISTSRYYRRMLEVTIVDNNPISATCASNVIFIQVLNSPWTIASQCINSTDAANMTVNFSPALPSGYSATYSWSGPNSFSSSSVTASVSSFGANNAGTYTSNVIVSNGSNSCPYTLTTQLNIVPNTPTFSIPATGCPESSFTPTGFTPQSAPSTISYFWNISPSNGSSTGLNSASPTFLFSNGGTYTISVTATNSSGNCSAISSTSNILLPTFSSENPTVGVGGNFYNPQILNGVNTIAICAGLSVSTVTIYNNNTVNNGGSNPAGVTYTYSLNGSSPSVLLDDVSQTIYYGNNNLIIIANYQGCSLTNSVNVYSGSNPFVSLGTSNSTGLCPGNALTFTINPIPLSGQSNPPGTSYTMTYSDSPGATNLFNDITGPTSVSHSYLNTSCGMTYPGNIYPANTFYAQVKAQNYCGQTSSTVSPITINNFPIANFTVTDSTICAGQNITVMNTGYSGSVVGNSYTCSDQGKFYWTISGGVSGIDFNVTSGVLGVFNTNYYNPNGSPNTTGNGTTSLNINFLNPGYYTITQHYHNGCGVKTKIRNICVINPPTSLFTVDPTSGCSPLIVNTNNTSTAPTCNGSAIQLNYVWTVTNPSGSTTSVVSNASIQNPTIAFTNTTLTPQTFNVNLSVIPMEPAASNIPFSNSVLFCPNAISGSPVVGSIAVQSNGSWNGSITGITGAASIPAGTIISATAVAGSLGNAGTATVISSTATTITFNSIGGSAPGPGSISNLLRASSGTVGSITGPINGVWTANITGLCSTSGITVGSVIYASNATGSIGSGGIYTVTAVSPSSITYAATGGTTPTQGTVTNLALTSCVATSSQSVIVYPEVNFTNAPTTTLCSGSTLGLNLTTNVTSTFTWVALPNANVSGQSATTQTGSSINDQLTNLTNTVQTVTYVATATSSTALGSCTKNQNITITVNPSISLTDPTDIVVCPGVSLPAIAFTTNPSSGVSLSWSNNTGSIGMASAGINTIASFAPVNNTNNNITATITVIPQYGICSGPAQTFTITVKPMPTVTGGGNQTICLGGSFNAINFSSPTSVANTTYNWTNTNPSIGLAISGTGDIATLTPSTAVSSSILVVPSANGCNGSTSLITLTTNPIPIISPIGDQTICSGSNSTLITFGSNAPNTTYAWTNSNTAIGLAASGSNPTIPIFATTNATNAAISGLITVAPTANGCPGTAITFTITVNPKPTVNPVSSIMVCNGAATGDFDFASTLAVPNTVFNWTNNAPSIGLASSGSGNITSFNAVNTGSANVIAAITITPTAGGCNGNTGNFTITVKPTPVATVPGNQSICAGSNSTLITFGSNAPNTTYSWTNSNTAIGLDPLGSNPTIPVFATTNATNAEISGLITISPIANGCAGLPVSFTITVKPLPTVSALNNLVFCNGVPVPSTIFSPANNVSGATFSWSRPPNPTLGLSLISGIGNVPSFNATNSGTTPIVNTITVTSSANSCPGPATSFTITVNPSPTVTVSANATQVKCTGVASNAVTFVGSAVTGTVYNWTNSNTTTGLSASSGTGNIASFTTQNTTNTAQVSTVVVTPSANGCSGTPVTFTITVNPNPLMQNLTNVTVCPQSVISANILSSTVSSSTYSWSINNSTVGLTPTSGTTSTIPSFTAINTGTTPLTATISITPSINLNSQACTGQVGTYTITVLPKPVMTDYNPQLFVFCENNINSTVNFSSSISSSMSYAWTNDNTSIGLPSSGTSTSPNAGITFTALNNTAPPTHQPITSNLTVTPTYTNSGVSCSGSPISFAITINPLPDVDALQSYTLCATETGSNLYSSLNPIVGPGTTYVWSNSNTAIGMAASGTGSHFFTSTNTTTSPIDGTVTVIPTYTNNGVSCTGSPSNFTITVNPMPTVNSIPNQGLCIGNSSTSVTPLGNIPNTIYTWTNNNTTTGLGAGGTAVIPSFTGLNTLNQPNVSTVNIVPSYTVNNYTCTGTAGQFGISINPTPNVDPIQDQQVCAQSNATVQFTSSPNIIGTVYNWSNNNTAIGLAASGTGALSFNATNTTNASISATVTVTPSFTSAGSTCWGAAQTFDIVVLPTPVMTALNNQTVCSGSATSALNFSANLSGTEFSWSNSNTSIGLLASGNGNSISPFNTSNLGSTPAQGLISVSPTLVTNNQICTGSTVNALITVNPIPVITAISNPSFCFGTAASIPLSSNINSGVVYNWTNSNTGIGLVAAGSGSISFTTDNTNTTAISGLVNVTPIYTNNLVQCTGVNSSFTIQVSPNPVVSQMSNQVFCNNTQSLLIPINSDVTGTIIEWTNANTSIGLAANGIGNIPVFNTSNSSSTSVTNSLVTLNPTLQFNGQTCSGPSTTFSITINPTTTINSVPNVQLCNGETSIAINFSGSGTLYSWTNSVQGIGINGSGIGIITPFSATNTGTSPISAALTVTSQFTGGGLTCNGNNTTFTIEVLPAPSVVDPPNIVICNGNVTNSVSLYGVATNYTWTNNTPSIGLTNTSTTATIPGFTATNTGASSVVATINISPSFVSGTKTCTGTSQSYTITVIPTPTISTQPQNQTVCIGGSLNILSVGYSGGSGVPTYQWYSSSTNSSANGTQILGATSANYTLPAANSAGTTYYYCLLTFPNSATCSVIESNLAEITISNGPTISSQPLASQSICVGGTISAPLSVAFSNGTGIATCQWYSVVGVTNTLIPGATSVNYMPNVFTAVGNYNYMVQVSLSGSGCGLTQSNTVEVNVLADPTITNPTGASYCLNSSTAVPLNITASGGVVAAYSYQWYANTQNNNSSGTVINGANTSSYIPLATNIGTIYYYCVVSQGNGCSVSSGPALINVTAAPTFSTQPIATQTVCVDGTLTPLNVAFASGSGTPTFQWYSNSINSYVGGVAIPGAASASYVPVTSSIGTIYYYCVITFAQSGCSSISSNISQIVVVADPVVTTQPLNIQTICGGGSIPNALNVTYSGGTGTLSYQWFSVNATTNTLIGSATLATYLPPAFTTPGTYNFAVQISLSGSGCGMVQSNNAQVIVLPDPTVSTPVSATYCNGYSPVQSLSVLPTGGLSGGYSYQWYSNTVNSNLGGSLLIGATTANFTPPVTTNGSVYYYCVVSQGAANTGCSVSSNTALITTTPAPVITTHPTNIQTACVGGTLNNLTVSYTGANTSPSYQWYSNSSNDNTGGTPIPGANASSYLPPNTSAGTNYYYCVISFPSIGCTTISSNPGAVTIHPDPIISVQPNASQAICFGSTLNAPLNIAYTGGYGTASYQWNLVNGSNTTPIVTANNASYLPSNYNVADTFYYNVTLSLSGEGCNSQASNLAEVIVLPVPIIDSVASYLYCNADTADMVVFSGPIIGTTYVWDNDNIDIGLGSLGYGNIMPFEVTNVNNNGIIGNITVTPQLTSLSTTCSGTPIDFMIMVNPYQDVQDPADLILCHGQGVNGIQFFGSALINNWTNDQPALGIPAFGSGTLPAFLAVNNGTQPIVANLSVTPTFNAVTTCPGDIETFTITILPPPNANVLPVNQLVCSGEMSSTINISGNATSFTWSNNQTSTGLAASGTGNIPAFLTTATGSNTTSTITVTPVYTMNNVSCSGPVQNIQITVVPSPTILPLQDIILCHGEATGLIPILGNANQLNWTSSNPSIGMAALGIGSIPSFNVINTGQNPISSVITIAPVNFFGGLTCMAPAENFSIIVNPTPTISAISDLVLCSQLNSPAIIFTGNANSYSWTNSNTAIGVSASGIGNISSFVTQNTLPSVISSVINVTPEFTNAGVTCQGTPESFVIDVLPQPSVNPISPQTICNTSATAPILFTGNATEYNWINNNVSIGIAASGNGNIPSFNTVAGATTNVANIVVTPTYVYNNTVCSGTPLTTTITVLPSPSINNVQDLNVCNGALSGVLAFSGTASTFNWTNSNPSIGLSSNGSGNLPVFTYANTSSNPLQAIITVVPQTGQGNQVCLGSPEIFTITVNPTPSMVVPSNQVLCSQTQSLPVNFSGNASDYSWINTNTSIGLLSFGNGSIPAFVVQNNGTATTTAQIQVTPQYINAGATCLGTSQNFTISVDPIPSIQYSQIGQAICTGTSTNAINLSSPSTGVTFSWNILNPSGSISGISSMNGTGNIPSLTLVNSSNSSAQFNFQGIATTNLASCVGLGPIGTITVDPAPILQPLNDITICSNDNVNDTLNANIPSTFSWSASSNPNISGQSTGQVNSNLIYNTLLNNSAVLQNITYTVTPTSFPLGCIGDPEDFVVEVVPNIQITSPLNYEICSGEPTNITLQSNFPGTFTFDANNNANVQGETSAQQTGFYINDILSNSSSYDQVVTYNVQVLSNPYGCFGIPQVVNVEVHPELAITNASPTQICSGAPLNLILTATENATFNWYATQNAIVTGESTTTQTSPILNDVLLNNANAWQEVIYTLSATSTVTGCTAQALPLSIIVNPIPVVSSLPDSVYCSGESTDPLNWTLNGNATNYAWVNTNSSIGLPLDGDGNIAAFTVVNPGPQTVVSTITVTPQYINNGFVCAGTPDQLTITVEPIPYISYSLPNQLFCSGDTSDVVVINSTTAGVNSSWQLISVPNTITGDPTMPIILSGLNQIPEMILSNTSTSPQQILFQGTVSTPLNGCTTVGPIGQIVVQPEPVITNVNDSTICNNGVVTVNIDASIPSTYFWSAQSNPNVNGESVGPVNSNLIYDALQNTSSTIQYVYYTITPISSAGNCVGVDQDFTIEVIPDIVIDTQLTSLFDSICSGEQTGIYLQTNLPATITWHGINNPNVLGETTTPTSGFYISDVLINNTPFNQYVNYSIDMISSPYGCFGIPEVITMQVFPAIQLTNATNVNLCSGDQLDINLAATVNASFTWSATNNGVVQGESTTTQNTSVLNDLLINNSALLEQVFYSVDVVANNSNCQAFDLPVTINVLPLPLLQNDDTIICSGQYTQINLVTNIPSSIIWNGVFNMDVQGETTANITGNFINDFLVNNSGQDDTLVYQIQAISNGCPAPLDSVLVIVHDQPDVDFIVSTTPLCTDNQVQFTNLSSPLFDYDWTFGDGGSSLAYSPTHIYVNSGLYEVMLIATNPLNNCTAADSVNVIINKSPDASFYTMDTVGCGDLNATFFANYQATSDMVWDFGDGQTLTQVGNVTNYYGQAGCYDVTLTVTSPEGCVEQETYDDYVCVYENPIAFIGASPMSVNALEPTVQFSNSSQNAISYMWQMGDGSISYDDNPTYTYPMEGADYYVLMTAYNEVGCFDTASVSIHVYEELIYYVPNTFTPNDDEKNQTFYPVLSQGMKKSYVEFYIYNRWGELVFESHDPKYGWDGTYGSGAIDCPIGTYTWKLKLETLQTQEILEFHGHVNLIR